MTTTSYPIERGIFDDSPPPRATFAMNDWPGQTNAAASASPIDEAYLADQTPGLTAALAKATNDTADRLAGLHDFAGPAMSGPLSDAHDVVVEAAETLECHARELTDHLRAKSAESPRWAAKVGALHTIAITEPGAEPIVVREGDAATEAVWQLWQDRERGRDRAVELESENARLAEVAHELAGARAYAAVLEENLAATRAESTVRRTLAKASRNAEAAAEQSRADQLAAALLGQEG